MHCINIYIAKKQDLIFPIVVETIDLECECVAFKEIPTNHLKEGSKFIYVETDYFGGSGEQNCVTYQGDHQIDDNLKINQGLKFLGIIKTENCDEFDSVGLGNFRSNEDLFPTKKEKTSVIETMLKDLGFEKTSSTDSEIENLCLTNEHGSFYVEKNNDQYFCNIMNKKVKIYNPLQLMDIFNLAQSK